jgi:hypothetical protein
MVVIKGILVLVWLVLWLHHGDYYSTRGLKGVSMCDECYQIGVVSLLQHLRDPSDSKVTMGVTGGGVVTPLSVSCTNTSCKDDIVLNR